MSDSISLPTNQEERESFLSAVEILQSVHDSVSPETFFQAVVQVAPELVLPFCTVRESPSPQAVSASSTPVALSCPAVVRTNSSGIDGLSDGFDEDDASGSGSECNTTVTHKDARRYANMMALKKLLRYQGNHPRLGEQHCC